MLCTIPAYLFIFILGPMFLHRVKVLEKARTRALSFKNLRQIVCLKRQKQCRRRAVVKIQSVLCEVLYKESNRGLKIRVVKKCIGV